MMYLAGEHLVILLNFEFCHSLQKLVMCVIIVSLADWNRQVVDKHNKFLENKTVFDDVLKKMSFAPDCLRD